MPKVIVDLTNVPDSDRASYDGPTPNPGLYKVLFKRGWWTKTNDGQKTMLKVLFVFETEHAEKKQYNGYPLWHNITYEASTQWKMKELFTALGTAPKSAIDFDDKGTVTRIGKAMPGRTYCLAKTKDGMWKGQRRLEIDTLSPIPRKDGDDEEFDANDEFTEEGDATPFEEAGGVVASSTGEASMGDVPDDDPFAQEPSQDEPPF